jgi:N-acetylneuraminate synthase/N,N'-diacetyllegionaminate synthase
MVSTFQIDGRPIGNGAPCFVIAEAGVNHDGDRDRAHDLVDAAAAAGADAVKFQTWQTDKLIRPGARLADYQSQNSPEDADQYALLRRLEMPYAWHEGLKAHAERLGLVFLSTPDEIDSARFLCDLGVPALKVGSAELTNRPYLRQLARLGKPLILSTGMSDLMEVELALAAVRTAADVPVALLHCVSCYPAPDEEQNLRALPAMAQAFGVPVGFSDHTTSAVAPVAAAALGMAIYERHLTVDRNLPGPDHAASTEPADFARLVAAIRNTETLLGDGRKRCMPSEHSTRLAVARSLHYTRALPPGHVLTENDLIALRPGDRGLPPAEADALFGRPLLRAVAAGDLVQVTDLS